MGNGEWGMGNGEWGKGTSPTPNSSFPIFLLLGDVCEDKEREHAKQQQRQGQPWIFAASSGFIAFDERNGRSRANPFLGLFIDAGSTAVDERNRLSPIAIGGPIPFDEWSCQGRSKEASYTLGDEFARCAFLQRYCGRGLRHIGLALQPRELYRAAPNGRSYRDDLCSPNLAIFERPVIRLRRGG